ncbi:maleylpyruvate isomerase family mycothiol-dependent enzyme [Arsenicicoccus dermatophilus]|uniref:maleylpyruvate isomerase family mycothiol-dependent enzyme n=1 Tax=Arsenicicoccus dermatophilus TaxID=1076331 RepID=UPI001F4D1ACA|nr:maleylpyruvate isomerase family mycothiol-dependent enzyme [Arsenicicoccus dermatophilus]MCH8611609.1 maleylpyruvate isomerase family mycothiol-dependent enzyme [Arsenicicoccus dermatophilus]
MPIHPAPPTDLPGLVAAFTHTVQAVIDLGRRLTDEQLELPTDCPGWTVKDQISHVVALEAHLEGLPEAEVEVPERDHVRNELGRFTERGVEARRSRPGQDVVRELEYVLGRRVAALGSPGLELDSVVPTLRPEGGPVGDLLRQRCLDVWVHEQDIRTAIDEPGNLDSPASAIFVDEAVRTLPSAIARRAQVPVGDTVMLELTGPVTTRIGVRVDPGTEEDPRPVGTVLFGGGAEASGTGTTTTSLRAIDPTTQVTVIKLSTRAFERLAAGRRDVDDVTYTVAGGDQDLARRVLGQLSFVP